MGRHPVDDLSRRSKQLRLRLTPAEYFWIKTIAKEKGINMRQALWYPFQKELQQKTPDEIGELNVKVVQLMKEK
jgi:hypothetical protein